MKRIAELHGLSEDHHAALVLALRCKKYSAADSALSVEKIWEYVLKSFKGHLAPHFDIEEKYLLPALEELGEAEMSRKIREDHAALRKLIQSESIGQDLINKFGRILESHARYEERVVFEETQYRMDKQALQNIERACRNMPRNSPEWITR